MTRAQACCSTHMHVAVADARQCGCRSTPASPLERLLVTSDVGPCRPPPSPSAETSVLSCTRSWSPRTSSSPQTRWVPLFLLCPPLAGVQEFTDFTGCIVARRRKGSGGTSFAFGAWMAHCVLPFCLHCLYRLYRPFCHEGRGILGVWVCMARARSDHLRLWQGRWEGRS